MAPRTSLGLLFFAAQLLDVLFPVFFLLGIESAQYIPGGPAAFPYVGTLPWSHSLLGAVLWAILLGLIYAVKRPGVRALAAIGLAVLSHWALDFISHSNDVRILPDGAGHGLGLSNSISGTLLVETAIFAVGLYFYFRTPLALFNLLKLVALIAFLVVMNLAIITPSLQVHDTTLIPGMFVLYTVTALWAAWAEKNPVRKTA